MFPNILNFIYYKSMVKIKSQIGRRLSKISQKPS